MMDFSQDLVRGSVLPIILSLLREESMYGYQMVKKVNARTNGLLEWKEGTLYPALHRLEGAGLIVSRWDVAGGKDAGRQRKYYSITPKGRRELEKRSEEWRLFSQAVNACLWGA